jgi:ATP-dependent helicase STH1/SNF2
LLEDSNDGQDEGEEGFEDDDINELIARSEEELQLYRQMDIERKERELREWRERGGTGDPPERLIQLDELPEVYRQDDFTSSEEDVEDYGRGQRHRERVYYDDFLTEDQFIGALEDDEVDLHEFIRKKQESRQRREERKRRKEMQEEEGADGSDAGGSGTPARRNRQSRTPRGGDDRSDGSSAASAKRGRKRKNDTDGRDSDHSTSRQASTKYP